MGDVAVHNLTAADCVTGCDANTACYYWLFSPLMDGNVCLYVPTDAELVCNPAVPDGILTGAGRRDFSHSYL